jgi:exosome complex component MTR3
MPRRPAKLSNCYVPLPLPPSAAQNQGNDENDNNNNTFAKSTGSSSNNNKRRYDGRSAGHELRRMVLETSVITRALGSSLVELGHTKVIAEVQIAAAATNNNNKSGSNCNEASNEIGCLKCHVKYAPHIGINQVSQRSQSVSALDSNSNSNNNNNNNKEAATNTTQQSAGKLNQEITLRESDLSRRLTASLLPVLILEKYPKCTVIVTTTVLQDDGSCLSAAITAASMALVDARVELRDVVTSCTVAVVENTNSNSNNEEEEDRWLYLADPTEREVTTTSTNVALICLAMTPNHKEVTLWSQSGRLSSDMASHAMELCRDGCRTMHKFMRESWISSLSSSNENDGMDYSDSNNKMKQ